MCGIAGLLSLDKSRSVPLAAIATRMTRTLSLRGPDDEGTWADEEAGIALGHRRLAIIDLSTEGHQPMHSACGRYTITFNGEIYNFRSLRQELEQVGYTFRGHSDTEVMLAALGQWGVERTLQLLNGMFAFALWDHQTRNLHLVRDRVGEKPLYYGWVCDGFVFGSELKALKAHPDFVGEVNRDALALMMRYNYVPAPYSIYKDIYKLLPGSLLTIKSAQFAEKRTTFSPFAPLSSQWGPLPFWSAREIAEEGVDTPFSGDVETAIAQFDVLLRDAVNLRMVADVPLGAFLSGGIDSSTIVALMQVQSDRPVKTFTIGSHDARYNEAVYANQVAKHLGTDHTELYLSSQDVIAAIPQLPHLYDEPFADPSQLPTFLVSQLARQHVTVSLSGDGGDELFGGYKRYEVVRDLWPKMKHVPLLVRRAMAGVIRGVPIAFWNQMPTRVFHLINRYGHTSTLGDKVQNLAGFLTSSSPQGIYHRLVSHLIDPAALVVNASEPTTALTDPEQWGKFPDFVQWMMYIDLVSYLPDDILAKVDRASMGVSLETRLPFLDHRVVEFAWKVPLPMKFRRGQNKWLLRQVLHKYVPQEMFNRPKMGFGVPIDLWLRDPLREWAEALLDERRLREEGFFDSGLIREKWGEHLSGARNWQYLLWNVLMFQMWLEHNGASPSP